MEIAINTSDLNISGWEIHAVITMINDQIEKGFFFRHDIEAVNFDHNPTHNSTKKTNHS